MATKDEAEATEPQKTCFIVCPIGSDLSPQRKHSDQTLRHIIAPVLKEAGFEDPYRADKISESGNITRQIINHIREDSLVIADLTGHNPNVFYELAIRHCTGMPFIQMIRKGENIPFDLGPMRTIFFDLTDPDDVVATKGELARQVASAMTEGAQVDTPIGAAMDFEKLKSGGGVEQMLSTLIDRVDALSTSNRRQSSLVRKGRVPPGELILAEAENMGVFIDPMEAANIEARLWERIDKLRGEGLTPTVGDIGDLTQDFIKAAVGRFPGDAALNRVVTPNRQQRRAAARNQKD